MKYLSYFIHMTHRDTVFCYFKYHIFTVLFSVGADRPTEEDIVLL